MGNDVITLEGTAPKHNFALVDPSCLYMLVNYTVSGIMLLCMKLTVAFLAFALYFSDFELHL
jgi:hypothetical protein